MLLFLHMVALVIWSGANAARWASASLAGQFFWLRISMLGTLLIQPTLLIFALQLTRNSRSISSSSLILLWVFPLLGLLAVWTNDAHHLVYHSLGFRLNREWSELVWTPGPLVWMELVYRYSLLLATIFLLHQSSHHGSALLREQSNTAFLGATLSFFGDASLSIAYLISGTIFDASPIIYTLAGVVYYLGIIRNRMFDLIPVAHTTLIQSMNDGVIVLDLHNRIVEINPAAGNFLGIKPEEAIGQPAQSVLFNWNETTQPFWGVWNKRTEIIVSQTMPRHLDLIITPLLDEKNRPFGRLLVFRDITERKKNEAALRIANHKLQEQLKEITRLRDQLRELAIRDPLTNLYNRRYLQEVLDQELARAHRAQYPVCLIMIDIDHFKHVNDICGHKVGDEVLQFLASQIALHIRRSDTPCRYGGEEFLIVMPNVSIETAHQRAEKLRVTFASHRWPCSNLTIIPTISIGIAIFPFDATDPEQLIDAADRAMYAAKRAGRNRITLYSQLDQTQSAFLQ